VERGGVSAVLLDTHTLVWLVAQPDRLGRQALRLAEKAQSKSCLHVSAISFWEIAMLVQRGALKLRTSPDQWRADVLRLGVQETGVDGRIAIRATELMGFHPDPADRIITATALELGATLLTADAVLLEWRGKLKRQDARC
jgi:PIN domain nuclease of toxin-antitoxin system